jgi:hypothetical protein
LTRRNFRAKEGSVSIVIGILLVLAILVVARYIQNSRKVKGAIGESRVAGQLQQLPQHEYEALNDILLKTDTGSSQIDHIVLSKYGIFVIESKNYSGWIHGKESSEIWTQSIYKSKSTFRNPIKQNWAHIYALREVLLDFGQLIFHPIVVFAGSAELKNVATKTPVIYAHQLFQTIVAQQGVPELSIEQVKSIANRIREVSIQDKAAKKDHFHQVQEKKVERKQKEKALICPRCGSNLVAREGPYGKFYGCANYPQCRYTLSADQGRNHYQF